ncbi:MAG: hypothetical protein K6E16_01735 [Lachnospiraceae bacterium]|nr:hypothetical protein [Lachnospiraceae bacterium]
MKKMISLVLATVLCAGALAVGVPTETDAALSCTYDTIDQANAQIVAAQSAYAQALADEAAYKAAFDAVKNEGPASVNYTIAANAYQSAVNRTKWAYDQVTNAQAFLANIKSREVVEDDYLRTVAMLPIKSGISAAELDAKSAQEIANTAAAQIAMVNQLIAGYRQQLAVSPSLQNQINELTAQLPALQADYAAKQAIADQKKAAAAAALSNYPAGYDAKYIDYWKNRDSHRENPVCDCYDYYTDTCHCSGTDCGVNNCHCGDAN